MTGKSPVRRDPRYKWRVLGAIAVGLFTSVADNGSVMVALPTISEHFGTTLPTTQWVFMAYALAVSALLLPMGRLSDIVGRKQVYVAGFVAFLAGAITAGFSTDISLLIGARVLMGVGAAMTQGTSMAMVVEAFGPAERGKALGLQMSLVGTGNVAGLAAGGLIISAVGWRGVFFTTSAMAILSILVAQTVLDGRRTRRDDDSQGFDWPGATLSTAVLVAFLLAMTSGPTVGWTSPPIAAAIAGIALLWGVFIWWELRVNSPMLDLRLFSRPLFSLGVGASFMSFIGMTSVRFLMPFYLQAVLGYTPRQVGFMIVPSAVAMIITGPVGGRLSDRYGWARFNVGGLAAMAAGISILASLTANSSPWPAVVGMTMVSSGSGIFNAPNNSSIFSAVPGSRHGVISGFLSLVRNSANITGIAMVTAIITAVMATKGHPPTLAAVSDGGGQGVLTAFSAGLRIAYIPVAALLGAAMVLSFLQRGRPGIDA